jgi:hypothetical protein
VASNPSDNSKSSRSKADDATKYLPLEATNLDGLRPVDTTDFDVTELGAHSTKETDRRTTSSPPTKLGEYLIQDRIGAGGMGMVFRARHQTMQRDVALKILPHSLSNDPELVERFYSEVRTIAKLMHPNIVTAFDAGCQGNIHYLVMELVEGTSLSSRLGASGVLNVQEAVDLLAQAASALHYAHQQGVIHRDIKPGNMMWTNLGVLKLLDFGLARFTHEVDRRKGKKQLIGTVEYMSPEQIESPDRLDGRSDLYSLGASLFFLLTGRAMFSGEPVEVALAHLQKKPSPLYEVRSDLDLRIDSIFQKLVAKHPGDRFDSGQALLDQLRQLNLLEETKPAISPNAGLGRLPSLGNSPLTHRAGGQSTSERGYAAIGIELGATQSRASFFDAHRKLVEVPLDGEYLTIRNMLWSEGTQVQIGEKAAQHRASRPNQIFFGFQRWFGLPFLERAFGDRQVPPEVLLSTLLRHMAGATRRLDRDISHAVITVPGCYDQLHRLSVANACRMAGLEVLQLLDRPLAATLAYLETQLQLMQGRSSSVGSEQHLLVVVLSGTGCEASVVRIEGLEATAISVVGDWKRGKMRWQNRLAEHLAHTFQKQHQQEVRQDLMVASRLQRTVELAIDRLSVAPQIDLRFEAWQREVRMQLDRVNLLGIVGELAQDPVNFADRAIQEARIDPAKLSEVLVIGSLLELSPLRESLRRFVPKSVPIQTVQKGDLARGAALQAQYLMPPTDPTGPRARARSTYDIGVISIEDGQTKSTPRILIPRQTLLPHSYSRTLRFSAESSSNPMSKVLQFVESTQYGPANWHRLGSVDPVAAFPKRQGDQPLQLGLEIDHSGLLGGKLTWLAGNSQAMISPLAEPPMDVITLQQWENWIETLLLCNTEAE